MPELPQLQVSGLIMFMTPPPHMRSTEQAHYAQVHCHRAEMAALTCLWSHLAQMAVSALYWNILQVVSLAHAKWHLSWVGCVELMLALGTDRR